ncbi:MAG: redox-regulated ATPase YchF [Patescibacteria group bacterium]
MSFSIGIVGLPNVGKSTLFKALTKKQVDIANFPFTTIKPNVGLVKVPDERLDKLAEVLKPKEVILTYIEFVDIAGLVKGAHLGEGLGNQFLSHIRKVEAIAEVIRDFQNPNVIHVAGKVDPKSDREVVDLELIFADLKTVEKRLEDIRPKAKSGDKEAKKLLEILEKIKENLNKGQPVREMELNSDEKILIHHLNLLTIKPIIYIFNIDEEKLTNQTNSQEKNQIKICAKLESELADLPEEETKKYLKEYGLKHSGLDELILVSYRLLNLITFFTCQNQILQAWTVPQGTKAPQAAGKIHTDFEKNFIRAEVINWQDLIKSGSEQIAREKGLLKIEGKEYVIQDGDVIHFRFNL